MERARARVVSSGCANEEDAVITAFQSFLRRTSEGSYAELSNRNDLWRLLVTITARKVLNQVRGQRCEKRGGELAESESVSVAQLEAAIPTPEFLSTMDDSISHLLSILGDGELEQIVILRLEGYSNQEIAARIGRSLPTVERRLRLIREKLQHEVGR